MGADALGSDQGINLYDLVTVQPEQPGRFVGAPVGGPYGRIFGGQLFGQAVMAATATVHPERAVHSAHAYFVRAGSAFEPLRYEVETVRDGRAFSVRSVTARQGDRVLLEAVVSFQTDAQGLTHQSERPSGYPDPEDVPVRRPLGEALGPDGRPPAHRELVELRRVATPGDGRASVAGQAVWMRARNPGPSGPTRSEAVIRATLALATDYTVLETVVNAHGLTFQSPGLSVASLDHSVWWHAAADLDDWLLYVQESPWSGGERGFVTGRVYDRDGALVASVAQEGLLRRATATVDS